MEVVNGVLIGPNGHLFLWEGAHRVFDYALGNAELSAVCKSTFCTNLRDRGKYANSTGKRYAHLLFPDKQTVLAESLEFPQIMSLGAAMIEGKSDLTGLTIFPRNLLRSSGEEVFQFTDTHLNGIGSIAVSGAVARRFVPEVAGRGLNHLMSTSIQPAEVLGDLGAKLDPQVKSMEPVVKPNWRLHYESNQCFMQERNNGIIDFLYSPDSLSNLRLMIFGDSFVRGCLVPLSLFFQEVLFLRTPYFHPEMADAFSPDVMLTSCVERYLPSTRPDRERPMFLLFPTLDGQSYSPSREFTRRLAAILSADRSRHSTAIDEIRAKLRA